MKSNVTNLLKTVAHIDYVKPYVELVDMEVEGAILGLSFTSDLDNKGDNTVPETGNGGSISGRSGRARVKR